MTKEVVIIGAGALGLSCAASLSGATGWHVTVLERIAPGSGSSGLSVGVFTRQYLDREDIERRVFAVDLMTELEQKAGLKLRRIGFLRLGRDKQTMDQFQQSAMIQHDLGVVETSVIDVEMLQRLAPYLNVDGVVGALYCPTDGYLDGHQLCSLLAEKAKAGGAQVVVNTTVFGMRPGERTKYVVTTDQEAFPADIVVNAAGPWGAEVGARLGAPVEVVNERHEAYSFELPEGVTGPFPMTLDYVPGFTQPGLYFRHEGERQLVVGLHSNSFLGDPVVSPDDYFRGVTQEGIDGVVDRLVVALPTLELRFQKGWAGLYPHSSEQRLVLGPHPDNPDVIVGAGLGGIGLSMSPALGSILAEWVLYGEPRSLPSARNLTPRLSAVGK